MKSTPTQNKSFAKGSKINRKIHWQKDIYLLDHFFKLSSPTITKKQIATSKAGAGRQVKHYAVKRTILRYTTLHLTSTTVKIKTERILCKVFEQNLDEHSKTNLSNYFYGSFLSRA